MIVYPNPVSEQSLLSLPHEIQSGKVVIQDISGRMVYANQFVSNNILLGDKGLTTGQYIISVLDHDNTLIGTTKFIVQ